MVGYPQHDFMKKKESLNSWIKVGLVIVLIMFIVSIIGLYRLITNDDFYCTSYPEECVCEKSCADLQQNSRFEWFNEDKCWIGDNPTWKCIKQRKLNPEEKAIKDCNDNPRENNLCQCQEWEEELKCGGHPISKSINFKTQEELNEYVDSSMSRNDICSFYPSRVLYYLKVKDYIKGFNKQEKEYMDEYGLNYTIINIIATNDYAPQEFRTKYCTSSIPKLKPIEINLKEERCVGWTNETYKDKEDEYVLCSNLGKWCEIEPNPEYCMWYDSQCCTKKETLSPCQRGDENWVEAKLTNEELLDCALEDDNAWKPQSMEDCRKITTCRPKTDVEKLMDKDCDWLFGAISKESHHISLEPYGFQNLKTAWRAKECEI